MTIEQYYGINVLRDDLLPGGTKSIILPNIKPILEPNKIYSNEYVYATPVYGGFQIALSIYCKQNNIKATIFCAKRAKRHENTQRCIDEGAKVIEIPHGYLTVVEKASRHYCEQMNAHKIVFGAKNESNIKALSVYVKAVINSLGKEPDEIWCAVGSGMLVESILKGTTSAKIHGVMVGSAYQNTHERLTLHRYHKTFEKPSIIHAPFPSMPNYDLKAWEYCSIKSRGDSVLFWNVL